MSHRSQLERGLWDFMIGDDEAEVLRFLEAWVDSDAMHWGHYSLFSVAEVSGVPAAALCGFFENELRLETAIAASAAVNQKLGHTPQEAAAGWERAKSIANLDTQRTPGAWAVEHVATRPEFRRRGLVDRLIGEMLERGRERGGTLANIGVFIGNDAAQRAYEKAGFEVIRESRDAEFESVYGCPGARLLQRPI
jgi:ribosomal protein S18 acetylase RimI-like enzyme